MRIKLSILLLAGIFIFTSCMKDLPEEFVIDQQWNPDVAVPLVHAKLSLLDFYDAAQLDSILHVNAEGLITFIYKGERNEILLNKYAKIPNQNISFDPLAYDLNGQDSVFISNSFMISEQKEHKFQFPNSEEISKMELSSGVLNLLFESEFKKSGTIEVEIPEATKNGQSFKHQIPFNYSGQKVALNAQIDLSGYVFNLKKGMINFNTIDIHVKTTFDASPTYVSKNDKVKLSMQFNEMNYEMLQGLFGQYVLKNMADTMLISLFDGFEAGKIQFADPKYRLFIENSAGIPIQINSPKVISESLKGVKTKLSGSKIDQNIDIPFPSFSEFGTSKFFSFELNKSNSNIVEVINTSPNHFYKDIPASINSSLSSHENFLTQSSKVVVYDELELPFYGRTEAWTKDIVTDINIPDVSLIDFLQLNLNISNGLPIDVMVQVYMLDTFDNVLDSFFDADQYLTKSGLLDASGRVISPTRNVTKLVLNHERLSDLDEIKKLKVRATIATADNGSKDVIIYQDYIFDIILSMRVKLII